jgi:NTP pyrophosphatase (non-canonical NTP hydrolase)
MALGLAGETGEVVDEIKKGYRPGWDINPGKLLLEMGDVLWYWTRMCEHFGWSFEDVARANIDKLTKRRAAGGYVG